MLQVTQAALQLLMKAGLRALFSKKGRGIEEEEVYVLLFVHIFILVINYSIFCM